MKSAIVFAWLLTTLGVVVDTDSGALINIAAVGIMGVIAWFIRRAIAEMEETLKELSGRLRIAELNIERIAMNQGIRPRRYQGHAETESDAD